MFRSDVKESERLLKAHHRGERKMDLELLFRIVRKRRRSALTV